MPKDPIVMVCCSDIAGQLRGKGFPARLLPERHAKGVGWTPTNLMITAFGPIADSPWGPFGDLMLRPDLDTHVELEADADGWAQQFVLADICQLDGRAWDCCPRAFLKRGLAALKSEHGLLLKAAFEHEFHFDGVEERAGSAYNIDAFRRQGGFAETLLADLAKAGITPDTFMPEYGPCQYEVTVEPAFGVTAADHATILREVTRAAAARRGQRASFTPILNPTAVGNGVHVHFSLSDAASGQPLNLDSDADDGLAAPAARFIAGLLEKLPSITALTAASAISYLRLVPNRWSAAYNNLSLRNREAAVRICPVFETSGAARAEQFHFEFRAADAAASPYMLLGALVWAGVHGLRHADLPRPRAIQEPPELMGVGDLKANHLVRLPQSLDAALTRFAEDEDVKTWMSAEFHDAYLRHKRCERDLMATLTPEEQCARYLEVY